MQALSDSGRQLEFDACGELDLNGDTGISAGVKDELAAIIGEPRVIPVFSQVDRTGKQRRIHDREMDSDSHHGRED